MRIGDVDVMIDGAGPQAIVMIHGWPDTYALWDAQVDALKGRLRCVRFTLPGFDLSRKGRAYSLAEVVGTIRRVVDEACPDQPVSLLLHDWGCFFGYQFAMRHPQLVERVIGVDIGDAGSRNHRAELGAKGVLMVAAYQMWLALAWRISGRIGDAMSRWMARVLRCPDRPRAHRFANGLSLCAGLAGRFRRAPRPPGLRSALSHALYLRRAQTAHVPLARLDRGSRQAARQPRDCLARRALGHDRPDARVQQHPAVMAH